MKLVAGDDVCYKLDGDAEMYKAKLLTASKHGDRLVLQGISSVPPGVSKGQCVTIRAESGDCQAEVVAVEGDIIQLMRTWVEKREYFRVDDIFPAEAKKVGSGAAYKKPKIIEFSTEAPAADVPYKQDHHLIKMLATINAKLDLILTKFQIQEEGFARIESRDVNLSACGIKFKIKESLDVGDIVEIKMLLPTHPPSGVIAYGKVVRVIAFDEGEYEVAVNFTEIDDDAKEEIIQYTLNRQKEIIRKQRQQRGE